MKNDKNEPENNNDPFNFFMKPQGDDNKNGPKKGSGFPFFAMLLLICIAIAAVKLFTVSKNDNEIDYSQFRQYVIDGKIVEVVMTEKYFFGYDKVKPEISSDNPFSRIISEEQDKNRTMYKTPVFFTAMGDLVPLLHEKNIKYSYAHFQDNPLWGILLNLAPFIIFIIIYIIIMKKMTSGMGGGMGIFNAGQSRAKYVEEGKVKTRFSDVAGVDEAKEELVEIIDFLKTPKKYTEIGGKIPKGVLLVGPPGTGKTLLARAVAGEAGVPFYRISGSDFVEMFVGVGASRVRDLFKNAREKAPCIIFIDELDAIGKSRVNNISGNDEREQTLNQLLVEMDGFDNEKGLIILAATNRPDVLDPALLRPGRFDRQVVVDRPDVKGREAILKIHSKNVKLEDDVDFDSLAHATAGFAGADLANIVNEAALLAVRGGRKKVTMQDFDEAIEKTIVGLEKKNRVMSEKERKSVAVHETGHALAAVFTKGSSPVHKISIIPHGVGALGYTMQRSEEEKFLETKEDIFNEIDVFLGGRAAEQVMLGSYGSGASNDIQRATDLVRKMITVYGMSDKFQNVSLGKGGSGYNSDNPSLVREYAESTQEYIDREIARIMDERWNHVVKLLQSHKELLDTISRELLEKETMDAKQFQSFVDSEKKPSKPSRKTASKTVEKKSAK